LIEPDHRDISIVRQCELLGLSRSGYYYKPVEETPENLHYMLLMDKQYLQTPFYGVLRMLTYLQSLGYSVNIKRVTRLYRKMGLECIYPKPKLSQGVASHPKYPYLLKGLDIVHPNQVWSTDITYIPMAKGFLYLVAVIDWFSRYVLSWELSNSLDVSFCLSALDAAFRHGTPEIFNTDQGVQFTSSEFTDSLLSKGIKISMDGKGRAIDNVVIERLWWSVKYENVYLHSYETGLELYKGLDEYFKFYNTERLHQSLGHKTPEKIFRQG